MDRTEALRQIGAGERALDPAESFAGAVLCGAVLANATLRGVDLSGADLAKADLTNASCAGIRLCEGRLEQTVLCRADLTGADLRDVRAGQAQFTASLLEDARLDRAKLRFANLDEAVLDGASLVEADLWGASMRDVALDRACLKGARLDEAEARGGTFLEADLSGASLRRADFSGASLRGATLRDTVVDGASFERADLAHAILPYVDMTSCNLVHARLAGAWLERTRMRAGQLGGAVGEEVERDYRGAYDAYTALELNFRSLGRGDDESWAYRRRRRMGKLGHRATFIETWRTGRWTRADVRLRVRHGGLYLVDAFIEWLSDYGESLGRVLRAFVVVLLLFALLYWATGCLAPREDMPASAHRGWAIEAFDYLMFSLNSMTTVGPGQVEVRPDNGLAVLMSSMETVFGTVLLGLFGFVLGARMRR